MVKLMAIALVTDLYDGEYLSGVLDFLEEIVWEGLGKVPGF